VTGARTRGRNERWPAGLAALGVALLAATPTLARPPGETGLAKLASALRDALPLAAAPGIVPSRPALRAGDATVEVELRFTALTAAVVAEAVARGARVERLSYRYARMVAEAPLAALPDLAGLPGLTAIHPLYGAQTSSGTVQTQVDEAMAVAAARVAGDLDGSGVRVGLLSNSLHNRHGGRVNGEGCERRLTDSSPQRSGDLPPEVVVLDNGPASSNDEGTGMAEIVHDLAPGAGLLFASAFPDESTFADNITALRDCGADIIADDVLFFAEPMFQDGIIAQSASAAVADGALFFSAATNAGDGGVDQTYRDSDPRDEESDPPTGVDLHDFGAGRGYAAITLPPGCDVRLILQWSEPFSGTLGAGASTDLDLYVYGAPPPGRTLASSTNTQGCAAGAGGPSGDPLEILFLRRGATTRTVYVGIDHYCGNRDVRLRLVMIPSSCVFGEDPIELERPPFGGPAIYGHPSADGVLATAAVDQRELLSGGGFEGTPQRIDLQPYSSAGGALPFYFDAAGVPLPGAPVLRVKPELTAADGGDTAYFGLDSDDNGFPNFHGTSAAAPAAAAIAALLRQAAPGRSNAALAAVLRESARDIGAPGDDPRAGDGLVDPQAALEAVLDVPAGDCNGDGTVDIGELIAAVNVALGSAAVETCPAADGDGNGAVAVNELIAAVNAALG